MSREAKHPVQTTARTLELIEALKEADGGRVTDLAEQLDMGKSAVHSHLSTLHEYGYVRKDGPEYRLGLKFLDLGGYIRDRTRLHRVAEPEVTALAEKTGELANLLVEEFGMGVYLFRSKGDRAIDLDTYAGHRDHLHYTALGKAVLAHMPEERVDEIVERHGLPAVAENTITDPDTLKEELERTRERGYAIDDEEGLSGLRCVAAPIQDDDRVLGAVGVSAPTTRLGDDWENNEYVDHVCSAANVIELNIRHA